MDDDDGEGFTLVQRKRRSNLDVQSQIQVHEMHRHRKGQGPRKTWIKPAVFAGCPDEEHADDIEVIHASLQRTRDRILKECGPTFLPKLVESFVENFRSHLKSDGPRQIVCYALGRFTPSTDWGLSCRLQLILLQDLSHRFNVPTHVFDPAFSKLEKIYLESDYCRFVVIPTNEMARRTAHESTLFYMIHADSPLYLNLYRTNRETKTLQNVVLFGNSLKTGWNRPKSFPTKIGHAADAEIFDGLQTLEVTLPTQDDAKLFFSAFTPDTVLVLLRNSMTS